MMVVPINDIEMILFIILVNKCFLSTYFVPYTFVCMEDAMVHIRALSCSDNEQINKSVNKLIMVSYECYVKKKTE